MTITLTAFLIAVAATLSAVAIVQAIRLAGEGAGVDSASDHRAGSQGS